MPFTRSVVRCGLRVRHLGYETRTTRRFLFGRDTTFGGLECRSSGSGPGSTHSSKASRVSIVYIYGREVEVSQSGERTPATLLPMPLFEVL